MNRDEFMQQLARLLSDMPESERMEAIRYYNDYFDEAGPENESKVIQELGSPGKVAAIIKSSQGENNGWNTGNQGQSETAGWSAGNQGQSETAGWSAGNQGQSETAGWSAGNQGQSETAGWSAGNQGQNETAGWNTGYRFQNEDTGWNNRNHQPMSAHRGRGAGRWTLIIILLVFASPVIIGVGGGLLGALLGILAAIFGILISVFAAGAGFFFGGIVLVIKGIIKIWSIPAAGLVNIGGGFLLIALGIFVLIFFSWLTFRVLPRFCRATVNFISRLLHRRKGAAVQ